MKLQRAVGDEAPIKRQKIVDPAITASAPENPLIREEGAEALYRCYRDNVFGVPFFIVGRQRFWGVDRIEDFEQQLLAQALPDQVAAATERLVARGAASNSVYYVDHAGGCG